MRAIFRPRVLKESPSIANVPSITAMSHDSIRPAAITRPVVAGRAGVPPTASAATLPSFTASEPAPVIPEAVAAPVRRILPVAASSVAATAVGASDRPSSLIADVTAMSNDTIAPLVTTRPVVAGFVAEAAEPSRTVSGSRIPAMPVACVEPVTVNVELTTLWATRRPARVNVAPPTTRPPLASVPLKVMSMAVSAPFAITSPREPSVTGTLLPPRATTALPEIRNAAWLMS